MSTYIYNSSRKKVLLSGTDTVNEILDFLEKEGLDRFSLVKSDEDSFDYYATAEFEEKFIELANKVRENGNEDIAESFEGMYKKLAEAKELQEEINQEMKFR